MTKKRSDIKRLANPLCIGSGSSDEQLTGDSRYLDIFNVHLSLFNIEYGIYRQHYVHSLASVCLAFLHEMLRVLPKYDGKGFFCSSFNLCPFLF